MKKKRSSAKINSDIIEVILRKKETGNLARRHDIIYGARLNYRQAMSRISELLEGMFITENVDGKHRIYDVTKLGIEYMRISKVLERFPVQKYK